MDPEKVLLGSSMEMYEVEEDQDRDLAEEASLKYDAMNIIKSFSTDDFKNTYTSAMPHIAEQAIEIQRAFCYELLNKVEEVYDYVFPVNLDFSNQASINDFYKFLEFLEFDYVEFLARLWKLLAVDLRTVDVESYSKDNSILLIAKVDEILKLNVFSGLVSIFMRTYTKENLINFIVKKTEKSKMLVFLKTKEGEENESRGIHSNY